MTISTQTPYSLQNVDRNNMACKKVIITSNTVYAQKLDHELPKTMYKTILIKDSDLTNEKSISHLRSVLCLSNKIYILTTDVSCIENSIQFSNILLRKNDGVYRIELKSNMVLTNERIKELRKKLDELTIPLSKEIYSNLPNNPTECLSLLNLWSPFVSVMDQKSKNKFQKRLVREQARLSLMDSNQNGLC